MDEIGPDSLGQLEAAHSALGSTYQQKGWIRKSIDEAVRWARKALEIEPGHFEAHYRLVDTNMLALPGHRDKSKTALPATLHFQELVQAGLLALWAGEQQRARDYLERAQQLAQADPDRA